MLDLARVHTPQGNLGIGQIAHQILGVDAWM